MKFWNWIKSIFTRPAAPVSVPKASRADDVEAIEGAGKYYYFRDLLDNIDTYYEAIGKLRATDLEAFAAYSAVGGHIFNSSKGLFDMRGNVDARFVDVSSRPAFGYISLALEDYDAEAQKRDRMSLSAVFFQKVRYIPNAEFGNGDLYRVGVIWRARDGLTHVDYYPVQISADGSISTLREKISAGQNGRCWRWGISPVLKDLQGEHKQLGVTPKQIGEQIFSIAFNAWASAQTDVQVHIKRDGIAAVFCIDLLRTPYFFKDRDCEVDDNGKRRKIFHIVRTHQRTLRDGSKQWVKSHFRGMRRFSWRGFNVLIVMPDKHDSHLETFTSTALDTSDPLIRGQKTILFESAARRIAKQRWAA